jgi:hypothetical protein
MAWWQIIFSAREYEPPDASDADVGWAWDVERDGEHRTIGVEVSRALAAADKRQLSQEIRAALRSRGRTAVVPLLYRDTVPRRLVLEPDGIVEVEN